MGVERSLRVRSSVTVNGAVTCDDRAHQHVILGCTSGKYTAIAAPIWPMTKPRAISQPTGSGVAANSGRLDRDSSRMPGRSSQVENRGADSIAAGRLGLGAATRPAGAANSGVTVKRTVLDNER